MSAGAGVFLAFLACLCGLFVCQQLSRSMVWGKSGRTLLNPPGILALVAIVFAADFLVLANKSEIDAIARIVPIGPSDVAGAFWWFTACFWAGIMGITVFCWLAEPSQVSSECRQELTDQMFAVLFFSVAAIALVLALRELTALVGGLENTRHYLQFRFLYLRKSDYLQYLSAWFPVAAVLLVGTRQRLDLLALLLLAAAGAASLVFGFRDRLVLVGLTFLLLTGNLMGWCRYRFIPILLVGAMVAMTAMSALIRPQENLDLEEVLDLEFVVSRAFNSYEIAAPKNLVLVFAGEGVDRYPGQSLVNLALLPFPREWLSGAKTFGANIEFTRELRGPVFSETLSATSLGGFGELYLEGPIYGLIVVLAIFVAISAAFSRAITHRRALMQAFAPLVLWIEFHFVRTGLTELGLFVWLCVIPLVGLSIFRMALSVSEGWSRSPASR